MLIFAISGFVNGITSLILGILVYFKNKSGKINQIFGLFSLAAAIFGLGYGFWQLSQSEQDALFFLKILSIGFIFIPILFFHWVLFLLDYYKKLKKILIPGYIISLFFLIFLPTSLFIKNVGPVLNFSWWPQAGINFYFYIIYYIVFLGYSLYLLLDNYKKTAGYKREQIKYIIIGTIFGIFGGLTHMPLWFNIPILPFGTFFMFLYPLFMAYSISRYRLMDIRIAIGRSLIYLFSFSIIIFFASILITIGNRFVNIVSFSVLSSINLIVCILLFQPIFNFFEKIASKYFYYTFYSYQTVLTDLGRKLTQVLDLDKLSSLIVSTLTNTMKLDRTVILLRESGNGDYRIQKNIGFREENGISLVKDNFLTAWLEKNQTPLVYEELSLIIRDVLKKEEKESLEKIKENMKKIEAALCLPLFIENKISGMIVLGNKISGDPYSQQDIALLNTLANQSSIALQNAKLYDQVHDLSENLQEKVDTQTKELKSAYEELKVLDKAKSEFISLASHQLRTPLTAIKGYISMILEGSYGKLPGSASKPLNNVLGSAERLIRIVNDLLNISKIELGKMEINKTAASIEEIISACCEEMKPAIENKGLKLIWHKPKSPLPEVEIDKLKIGQVISNLVDNAIKYTQKGEIDIEARKTDSIIRISVKDTGEGLTAEELKMVFEGFTRGAAGIAYWIEGAGLGLYIAKKYVDLHNGKIRVESGGKGKGSIFYIELPIK